MDYLTEVAEFAAGFRVDELPPDVVERTKLIVADCVGAIVGGAAEPEVRALSARPGIAGGGPARLLGTGLTAQPAQAALVNGTAGTWLEMDEGNQFCKGHPGMHSFPAAFAFAESNGASGSGPRPARRPSRARAAAASARSGGATMMLRLSTPVRTTSSACS